MQKRLFGSSKKLRFLLSLGNVAWEITHAQRSPGVRILKSSSYFLLRVLPQHLILHNYKLNCSLKL